MSTFHFSELAVGRKHRCMFIKGSAGLHEVSLVMSASSLASRSEKNLSFNLKSQWKSSLLVTPDNREPKQK